jgi:hypothetical protein
MAHLSSHFHGSLEKGETHISLHPGSCITPSKYIISSKDVDTLCMVMVLLSFTHSSKLKAPQIYSILSILYYRRHAAGCHPQEWLLFGVVR